MKPARTLRTETPGPIILEQERDGLRILARIIARKRLGELAGNNENEQGKSSPDALTTDSTTVLQRGNKRK